MYGIIDYESRWVICSLHQHRLADDYLVTDKPQVCYSVSKYDNYVSKTNFYAGASVVKSIVRIISEEQYKLITTECEKIMKAKSLLTTTMSALVGSLPKPKIDEEITNVEFEND